MNYIKFRMIFKNRQEAGKKLALKLKASPLENPVSIGLPRGGVITAYEIAKELKTPLDIIVPRKIGAPREPELAIGAITESGQGVWDKNLIESLKIKKEYIDRETEKEKTEAKRRREKYRLNRPPLDLKNKTVLLIDDGIATGHTMEAAVLEARNKGAKKIIIAVPVIPKDMVKKMSSICDKLIYLNSPFLFMAIGNFYENFEQTGDEEVVEIMKKTSL